MSLLWTFLFFMLRSFLLCSLSWDCLVTQNNNLSCPPFHSVLPCFCLKLRLFTTPLVELFCFLFLTFFVTSCYSCMPVMPLWFAIKLLFNSPNGAPLQALNTAQSVTCSLSKPADCGLFSFSAREPSNEVAGSQPPPPYVVSGRVSKHQQACPCVCCVSGNESKGVTTTKGRGSGGRGGRKIAPKRKRMMEGAVMGGENLYANKNMLGVWKRWTHRCSIKGAFVWQIVGLGILEVGIPKIIQTGLVLVLLMFTMHKLSNWNTAGCNCYISRMFNFRIHRRRVEEFEDLFAGKCP